ncbi:MAG: hypothetical protein A3K19_06865 [Lentisphaerae bacterium RIFOXYB12_FULL_65_16]|nr:MAG: hypothetical protein A3K18_20055 [Lentisphaerae bacterium RIFOXYA12_64_32]OGV93171.1 MAG: hypothetical protein A3K19_06865 [Lentisphaerae bacterium RIFOXYB12_FULL_65_16]
MNSTAPATSTAAFWYGAAYYPEHWPEERWPVDARLMREAGFNVVRLGEFAWCRMEPEEDRFDFTWLDRAITVLQREGISVLLGTPTAGPPPWLVNAARLEDECRQVYEDGGPWECGGRSMCCVNHPRFQERSRRIAAELGRHFANCPAVIGFQIDNELGMYGTRCLCAHCREGFRRWLREKYGAIGEVNRCLGMIFGGNEFRSFDDIPIPRRKQDLHNPGLILDSQRFFSDANVRYVRLQVEALRQAGVRQAITTNVCHMLSGWMGIDNRRLFEPLDVVGWDCYPVQFAADPPPAAMGLLHAVARAGKGGRRFWMLEQQSGSPMANVADEPRRSRLWAWQAAAHGAEMILYFRWRTCRFGGEQYWRGILDHDGARNARYAAVAQTGGEMRRLAPRLAKLERAADVAILLDFDDLQSVTLNPPGPRFAYNAHAQSWFAAVQAQGRIADVVYEVPAPPPLGKYRLLIAPAKRLMDPQTAEKLRQFVAGGGTLVATPCTATLDRDHVAPSEPLPWKLTDVFGVRRVEWSALGRMTAPPKERQGEAAEAWAKLGREGAVPVIVPAGNECRVSGVEGGEQSGVQCSVFGVQGSPPRHPTPDTRPMNHPDIASPLLPGRYSGEVWCDHLVAAGAEVWARFAEGAPPSGLPAITCNRFGSGRAVYVATWLDAWLQAQLVQALLPSGADVASVPDGVEIVPCRDRSGRAVLFVLNHAGAARVVDVPTGAEEWITATKVGVVLELEPYGVAVVALASRP